jgi:hypothetical protein
MWGVKIGWGVGRDLGSPAGGAPTGTRTGERVYEDSNAAPPSIKVTIPDWRVAEKPEALERRGRPNRHANR